MQNTVFGYQDRVTNGWGLFDFKAARAGAALGLQQLHQLAVAAADVEHARPGHERQHRVDAVALHAPVGPLARREPLADGGEARRFGGEVVEQRQVGVGQAEGGYLGHVDLLHRQAGPRQPWLVPFFRFGPNTSRSVPHSQRHSQYP